jgi:hypothetical protein
MDWPTFQRCLLTPSSGRSSGPGSRPDHTMWDLWWTKWHWDRFYSESFGFPLSVSFHRCSIFIRISSGGWTNGPLETAVPHRHTHPIAIITIISIKLNNNIDVSCWNVKCLCYTIYTQLFFFMEKALLGRHVSELIAPSSGRESLRR